MSDNIYYHYTTITNGHAIIKSRCVWLTDYRFLNDNKELKQGYSLFISALPIKMQQSFKRAFLWHDTFNHHCVLSLSRSPKILSQWRTYADDGAGLALGFNEKTLMYAKIKLVPCQYDFHESYVKILVKKHLAFVEEVHGASQELSAENDFMNWIREHKQNFYLLIEDLIALKNPAFVEEQEVRAIRCVEIRNVLTRISGKVIIPYVEASFWDDDISLMGVVMPEIWLGPKCSELNMTGILSTHQGMCAVHRYDCGYI